LNSARPAEIIATFWNGNVQADHAIPASVPRPRLLRWHDWTEHDRAYRAELYEHVTTQPIATRAALTADPGLPESWWAAVRTALDTVTAVPTSRVTLHPGFLAWAMPRYLGYPADDQHAVPWTTAHGDFHYANLCAPTLSILDWEGWGTAPAGYDAAMLHSYSLLVPAAATRVRTELAHILDTDTGRIAELAVITELLYAAARGDLVDLAEPLRQRASALLDRAVPPITTGHDA
jgi:hypothetical protein